MALAGRPGEPAPAFADEVVEGGTASELGRAPLPGDAYSPTVTGATRRPLGLAARRAAPSPSWPRHRPPWCERRRSTPPCRACGLAAPAEGC